MLTMTEAAGSQLREMIDGATTTEDTETAVRFVMEARGLVMQLDKPRDGDTKMEHDGRVTVLLSDDVSQALEGKTLDVTQTENGPALVITA